MVFSFNPSAFDEQIGYTLKNYRDVDWDRLKEQDRPVMLPSGNGQSIKR